MKKDSPENKNKNRFLLVIAVMFISIVTVIFSQRISAKDFYLRLFTLFNSCDSYHSPATPPAIPPFHWHNTALISLWFDDAWISQFSVAAPRMEKMGFKGAVAVALKFICKPSFMSWDQLHELQNKGWETTSHSVTHNCDLSYYTPQTIEKELRESKQVIESHGLRADQFVMPCGYGRQAIKAHFNGHPFVSIVDAASKYYASYRTTDGEIINPLPVVDPYNLKAFELRNTTSEIIVDEYIKMAKEKKGWLIFVFHQIDEDDQLFAITPSQFDKVLTMIKDSGVPVVLPSQALAIGNNHKVMQR